MQLFEVLRRPLITEKTTLLQSQNKYAFEVARGANKNEIKEAVEKAFKVTVTGVNVLKVPAKRRRAGRKYIVTSPWRKALVTVKPGDKIAFFEGV